MNFHANVLNVFVSPGATLAPRPRHAQAKRQLDLDPAHGQTVRDGNTEVWLEREPTPAPPFSFRLHGSVHAAPAGPVQVTVQDPAALLRPRARGSAEEDGMSAAAGVSARTATPRNSSPTVRSWRWCERPSPWPFRACNVDSDNLYAESLVKLARAQATGQPGSWSNGTTQVRCRSATVSGPSSPRA